MELVVPNRKSGLMGWAGLLALAQACLVLWNGYKLGAIGPGAWLLLAGAALILANCSGGNRNSITSWLRHTR